MLEASDVTVRLGERLALDRVGVRLRQGAVTAIIGANGAGKSTLLRTLAGLLAPASGAVTLDGHPLSTIAPTERARRIAFLPQERAVHWPLAARAVVALGRLPHRHGAAGESTADRAAIDTAIADLDIGPIAGRPVTALSGGERARVLLARALAQEASILLADEPTASLDAGHQLALFELLGRLARAGRTVAVAIHDLSLAVRYASDAVLMSQGRVLAAGPIGEALTAERLAEAFGVEMIRATVDGVPVIVPRSRAP